MQPGIAHGTHCHKALKGTLHDNLRSRGNRLIFTLKYVVIGICVYIGTISHYDINQVRLKSGPTSHVNGVQKS